MQAGEIGVVIQANIGNQVNIAGATCSLVTVSPGAGTPRVVLSMTPDSGGAFATRNTLAGDFPVAGDWQIQFIAVLGGGQTYKSPVLDFMVGANL